MESATKLFPDALAHHRAGRLNEAESLYRSILDKSPDHADSLNLLGVIAHQKGDHARAIDLISRAITLQHDRPAYHCNLAAAFCGLRFFDQAAESSRTALRLDPNEPKAYLNLGLALQGAKNWRAAEQTFRELSERFPLDPRGPQSLGDCLRDQGRTAEALAVYRDALALYPDHGPVHLIVGTILLTDENPQAAEPHLRRAVELMPNQLAALLNFGSCLTRLQRGREAMHVLELAQRMAPHDANLGTAIGQALFDQKDFASAERWFNSVLQADASNAEAVRGLADVARAQSLPDAAVALYEQSLRLNPSSYATYRGLGQALWDLGDAPRAQATMREAIRLFPGIAEAHAHLGDELTFEGDFRGAADEFRTALRIQPYYAPALSQLALSLKSQLPDSEKAALETAVRMPNTQRNLAGLHYGLAHVEDARDNFTVAAEHFQLANRLEAEDRAERGDLYNIEEDNEFVDRTIESYSADCLTRAKGLGHASEQPVFVFGMPRSGTTLVEQILASHPRVFGAGERNFSQKSVKRLPAEMVPLTSHFECAGQISPRASQNCATWYLDQVYRLGGRSADRIVDKMPDNYLVLGWISIMFPKARLVHCRRDLRDVALSCWTSSFSRVVWANDFRHIAIRIRNYQRLMAHWRSALPVPMLELDYEDLVFNQEEQSRRLIEFAGLDWDPKCLEFHRTKRVVQTASVTQVRKPIYTRSVGRWRHYVETLRPLIEELGLGLE